MGKQKKENKMQLQKFARNPLVVEGIQVTEENFDEVIAWCEGESHTEPNGKYIKVKVNNPINQRQTKAFLGDWILISNRGFKVYTSAGLQNAFSLKEDEDSLDPDPDPSSAPRTNIFAQSSELRTTDVPVNPSNQISGKQ